MAGAVEVIKSHRHTLTHQAFTEREEFNSFKTLCNRHFRFANEAATRRTNAKK